MTWNTDKPGILHKNHPQAKLIMVEMAGHSPFEDEPEKFFTLLKDFTRNLPEIDLSQWKKYLIDWKKKIINNPG